MRTRKYDSIELKICALLTMFIDHIGAVLIENTYVYQDVRFHMLGVCLRLIGRIAFPIFAFLLTEGFLHTSNRRKYIGRMLFFAVISEIPFDLAVFGKASFSHQNVYFTLAIGLLVMSGMEKWERCRAGYLCVIAAGCATATILRTDYSYMGILLIAVFYALRENHRKRCTVGGILFSYEVTSIFAFLMIYRYSGEKGETKLPRLFFYGFYPAHLLALWFVKNMLLSVFVQ